MINKYVNRSRISESKFRQLIKCFSLDLEAQQSTQLLGISRNTINKYFKAKRIKGKRGRVAYGKTIVFGLLKRDGKVYTEIVLDVKATTLQAAIRGH